MASPLWQVRLADDEKLFNALDANSQKVADRDLAPISDTTVLTTALMPAVVTSSSAAAEEAAEAKAAAAAEAMAVAMSNASADETCVRKRAPPANVLHTAPSPTIARRRHRRRRLPQRRSQRRSQGRGRPTRQQAKVRHRG